ncbi:MAG: TRAP transporter permease [Deltaproteobacteria bacterium]|nr:TRAP transporter permease [Deltaproteobacteria bacterium]
MDEAKRIESAAPKIQSEQGRKSYFEHLIQGWSSFRVGTKFVLVLYIALALSLSSFHLYTAYFGLYESWAQRAVHVMFILLIVYFTPRKIQQGGEIRYYLSFFDLVLGTATLGLCIYMYLEYFNISVTRAGLPNKPDEIACGFLIFLVLEACRRRVGFAVTVLGAVFWAYTLWGHFIPGYLGHPPFSFNTITDFFFNNTTGVFGIPTAVSALYIILFIILAAFLFYARASDFFLKLSFSLTGTWRGGPAKAAVVASGLFGSIHGSGPGNVMATGVFTIPLMKRLGYPPHFAGAVEATASTGGILLPPVMGATAFLIAEFTQTPYIKVCLYGLLPALCYYLVIFIQVHMEALRQNLPTMEKKDLPSIFEALKEGYLLIPVILIVVLLIMGYSVLRAASVSIVAIILLSFLRASTRMGIKEFLAALETGASNAVMVAVTCATASIIVGSVSFTGFGTKLASLIFYLSMGKLALALFFTMIVAIICGMGMPATPVYVILISTAAPAMLEMGVPIIISHMFIFYFGTMAAITPPVALSCYAAASLADADLNRLSFTAVKLALAGFLIPFMFVYNPGLLLMTGFWGAVYALMTALPGFAAMGIGISGWFLGDLNLWRRASLIVGAIFLIWHGVITDLIGLAMIVGAIGSQFYHHQRARRCSGQ